MVRFLLYNRTDNPDSLYVVGDVVVYKPEGHVWGIKEGLPNFLQLDIDNLTIDQVDRFVDNHEVDGEIVFRRTYRLEVERMDQADQNALLISGYLRMTWQQIRRFIRNKVTNKTE